MQINGPAHIHGPQSINAPHRPMNASAATSAPRAAEVDQLDISPEADMVSRAREMSDIRQNVVSRVRAEIEAGTYETPEKLDIALGRMLDELTG
jgi:negative regulator of flagellin synthesis FlgM